MANTLQIIQEFGKKLKSNIIFVSVTSLILASVVFFLARTQKGTYATYSKIFPLSINKANGSSPMDAIKSQFGISDKTDYDKIYNVNELVNSRTISRKIVSAKTNNKKYKNLAQWIFNDYNTGLPIWGTKIKLKQNDSNALIYKAASLFTQATNINVDIKTGFTRIATTFHDKNLSKEVNETILEALSSYYIGLVTEKPRSDLVKIRIMRDSLKDELYAVERAIAGFQDANQLSVKYEVNIPQSKLLRTRVEIEQLYAVTVTAFQNAKFKLLSESPIFQVLDYPGEPYNYSKPSSKKAAIITFAICFFLLSLFVCRKIFGRIIIEELSKV
ncbi:MAG: hypothetical protein IT257_00310 [Chitinophagaceae bacterium]|nr:hypothetical protein [Chitinophagaceae bacterium]